MLESACYRLQFGSRGSLRIPAEWAVEYLDDAWRLLFLLFGAVLSLASAVATVLFFASLYARVPWVVRVRAFTFAPGSYFTLVLLR